MSLFNPQTIFNILITLIICSAMFIFFRFKLRILEVSQREQAKVLQSLVMSMRNGGHQRNMVSDDEIMKHVQMQMQQGGAGAGAGVTGNQSRHPNDLIDVSDDDDEDDDDESESSSDSEDDDNDSSSSEDEKDENEENHENTTKKIIFNNGGALDTHAHTIEHLTGDDIKVIELTEPLYAVGGGNVSGSGSGSKHDTNDVSDDDDDNDDDDNEDMSDDDNDNDDEETSDDTEVKVQELPSHEHEHEHEHEQHLETSVIDTIEIKTIFKADKQQQQQQPQQQHSDYNSMNVQALKQHLKTKLSADGLQYNETAINKLNKKELIKHLTQG
jgi:hypothetical protein